MNPYPLTIIAINTSFKIIIFYNYRKRNNLSVYYSYFGLVISIVEIEILAIYNLVDINFIIKKGNPYGSAEQHRRPAAIQQFPASTESV